MEGVGPPVENHGAVAAEVGESAEREPVEAEETVEGGEVEVPAGLPTEAFRAEAEGGAPGGTMETPRSWVLTVCGRCHRI